jgi:hypothetical protein
MALDGRNERPATGHGRPRSATFEPSTSRPASAANAAMSVRRRGTGDPEAQTFEPSTTGLHGHRRSPRAGDSEEKCRRRDFFADRAHNASSLVGGMSGAPPASAGLAPKWAATVVSGGFSSNRIPGGCGLRRGQPVKELRAGVPMRQNRRPMGGRHLSGRGGLRDSRQCFGPLSSHPHQVSSP